LTERQLLDAAESEATHEHATLAFRLIPGGADGLPRQLVEHLFAYQSLGPISESRLIRTLWPLAALSVPVDVLRRRLARLKHKVNAALADAGYGVESWQGESGNVWTLTIPT
jgi:hypothetical protein